jgi:hypothetical protein
MLSPTTLPPASNLNSEEAIQTATNRALNGGLNFAQELKRRGAPSRWLSNRGSRS